jgi:phosphoglycerate dehydrogenase-like enzyme
VTTGRLEEVLPETDLLILSLPATAETRNILDARRLALLPETARIVNVGRGSALDQKALERMLREGKLAGAALDVFEQEPIPADDPLWDCPNLVITPHMAGNMTLDYTTEKITDQFLEDLDNYAAGRPLKHTVDRKRAY